MNFILLSQSENVEWLERVLALSLKHRGLAEYPEQLKCVHLRVPPQCERQRSLFGAMAARIEAVVAEDRESVIVVERIEPLKLNPLVETGWQGLIAILALSFPDVRWVFGAINGYTADDSRNKLLDSFRQELGLRTLFEDRRASLFDGGGLRDLIRALMSSGDGKGPGARYVPRRQATAYALDEETPYANLHAYVAYRFGFRAVAIADGVTADSLLKTNSKHRAWVHEPTISAAAVEVAPYLVFEDVYVNFIGKSELSDLAGKRRDEWPHLESAHHRILVTSGQRISGDEAKWTKNAQYLAEQKANGVHVTVKPLYKPYAGIFRLWEGSELAKKLGTGEPTMTRGHAPGFVWPPPPGSFDDKDDVHDHSSPAVLLLVSERLLARAEKLLGDVRSVDDAVIGAVLAGDALELLGGRTATISFEALALKHRFEVLAECQFTGVEHHMQLKERTKEIQRDAEAISRWFGERQQRPAAKNAEMQILTGLSQVFSEYGQFDEQNRCLNRMRHLHNRLWMGERPIRYVMFPLLWYLELLLRSFAVFVVVIAGWIIALAGLYYVTVDFSWPKADRSIGRALSDAISSFFSIGGPIPSGSDAAFGIVCLAIVAGFFHLGVFISHLYSIVSRK